MAEQAVKYKRRSKLEYSDIEWSVTESIRRKIEAATIGVPFWAARYFLQFTDENKVIVADFINDCVVNDNSKPATKRIYITSLFYFQKYLKFKKSLKEVTGDDVMAWLATYRKTREADPEEKWINTHNQNASVVLKFFKWMYAPDAPSDRRPKPEMISKLVFYQKKEVTSVKAEDLWTPEEDSIFLKYCEDDRIKLYHVMSLDNSGRPHEILALRNGDPKMKQAPDGRQYAEAEIGRGGKTKSRTVPLIRSLPYYKAWLAKHPQGTNANAFLFPSLTKAFNYRNRPLQVNSLQHIYNNLKKRDFPKLLERSDVPPEDKMIIKRMLQKPWNPYLRRHISLTEKARIMPNDHTLRLHAGWTKGSNMPRIYTHELGGESSKAILTAMGFLPKENESEVLMPKLCHACHEANKPDALYCVNEICGAPLSDKAYFKMKEEHMERERQIDEMLRERAAIKQAKLAELKGTPDNETRSGMP